MFITSPDEFAALFNEKYPGTYRQVTAQDVRDMTICCLIGRYECYLKDDLEFIRGILNTSNCERRDPHGQLLRENRNHQNVRDVRNLCHLNPK
jgi:hypothetical protein